MFKKFDDSAIHHPMDIRYMRMLRILLRMLCSWPHKALGEELKPIPLRNKHFLFWEGVFCAVGGIIYVRNNYKEVPFLEMGQTYLTIFLSFVAAGPMSPPHIKYQSMEDTALLIHQKVHKICDIISTLIVVELYFGVALFNISPAFNNYRKGMFNEELKVGKRFEYSIHYALPFVDQRSNLVVYILNSLINILFSTDCGFCFLSFDIALFIIVFHIWGHLKILDHELSSILPPAAMRDQPARSDEALLYSKEENKHVAVMLKNIVDHHRKIMSFLNKSSDAFGPMLCLYYLFHQVSGCILFLVCSKMDPSSLARYVPLSAGILQLFIQVSVIVELLGSQSETLKDAVYNIPWECMDTSNRRIVLFLLCNVQEPIRLKPLGMVSVGVQTMATILKTSFSYFMLLRTFA